MALNDNTPLPPHPFLGLTLHRLHNAHKDAPMHPAFTAKMHQRLILERARASMGSNS